MNRGRFPSRSGVSSACDVCSLEQRIRILGSLLTLLSTGSIRGRRRAVKLLNLGINLKLGGDGRSRFHVKLGQLIDIKRIYGAETPCMEGPEAGGEPVDSFAGRQKGLFYPQMTHTLCISHTDRLWMAWNGTPEFLEFCGTVQRHRPQISRRTRRLPARCAGRNGSGHPPRSWIRWNLGRPVHKDRSEFTQFRHRTAAATWNAAVAPGLPPVGMPRR